jgi:hypothetical protein
MGNAGGLRRRCSTILAREPDRRQDRRRYLLVGISNVVRRQVWYDQWLNF